MITREALRALADLGHFTVCDPAPEGAGCAFRCVGCERFYDEANLVFSDNGPVCKNCCKAIADSYFD